MVAQQRTRPDRLRVHPAVLVGHDRLSVRVDGVVEFAELVVPAEFSRGVEQVACAGYEPVRRVAVREECEQFRLLDVVAGLVPRRTELVAECGSGSMDRHVLEIPAAGTIYRPVSDLCGGSATRPHM